MSDRPVVTATVTDSPPAGAECVVGEMAYVQPVLPACTTVKICPAIVTVPVRSLMTTLAGASTVRRADSTCAMNSTSRGW